MYERIIALMLFIVVIMIAVFVAYLFSPEQVDKPECERESVTTK